MQESIGIRHEKEWNSDADLRPGTAPDRTFDVENDRLSQKKEKVFYRMRKV